MRVFGIASGVPAVGDVDRIVGHLLHLHSLEVSLPFLCRDPFDARFFRIEIVGDGIHRIGSAVVEEFGTRRGNLHRIPGLGRLFELDGVRTPVSVDLLVVHVNAHEVGLQIHLLILHIAFLVNIYDLFLYLIDQRVFVLTRNHIIQKRLVVDGIRRTEQ